MESTSGARAGVAVEERPVSAARMESHAAQVVARFGLTPGLVHFALALFALSRLGFVVVTVAALRFLRPIGGGASSFVGAWARYDATYYARLAQDGYQASAWWREAFFPLQPLLTRLVAPMTAGDVYAAGMVVSNVSFLVALLGMGALAMQLADERLARRAMLYLTFFPMGLFFFAGYADALFLAAAIWCLVALRHQSWWLAGLLGLFATLTRQMGLFLVIPFAYEYARAAGWRPGRMLRPAAAWALLIPAGLGLFMAWLWHTAGDPLGFVHAERYWQHSTSAPWATLIRAVELLPHQPDNIFFFKACVDVAIVAICAVLIIAGVRSLPAGDTAYGAAIWLLALVYPAATWPLQSDARYMALAFPCFLVLARWGRRPWVHALVLLVSGVLLALLTQYYVRGAVIL